MEKYTLGLSDWQEKETRHWEDHAKKILAEKRAAAEAKAALEPGHTKLSSEKTATPVTIETLPSDGVTLGHNEAITATIDDKTDLEQVQFTFEGDTVQGRLVGTIRIGGDKTYTDVTILDIRDSDVYENAQGRQMRDIGVNADGAQIGISADCDFMLIAPSEDGKTYARRGLIPGKDWELGREGFEKSHTKIQLPDTVEFDHCSIGMTDSGELKITNHEPTNRTTLLPPQATIDSIERVPLTEKRAYELLAYGDILTGSELEASIAEISGGKSGKLYAEELISITKEIGIERLLRLAARIHGDYDAEMAKLSSLAAVESKRGKSISWVLWDIAKQRYFAKHPSETTDEYKDGRSGISIGDPIDPVYAVHKIPEIIKRHIGWELEFAVTEGLVELSDFAHGSKSEIRDIFYRGRLSSVPGHRLSSVKLTRIGKILTSPTVMTSLPPARPPAVTLPPARAPSVPHPPSAGVPSSGGKPRKNRWPRRHKSTP